MGEEELCGREAAFEGGAEDESDWVEVEGFEGVVDLMLIDLWSVDEGEAVSKSCVFGVWFVVVLVVLLFPFLFFEVVDALGVAHENDRMIHIWEI